MIMFTKVFKLSIIKYIKKYIFNLSINVEENYESIKRRNGKQN